MPEDQPHYLCIYHGNCADGFGAAWVVRKALGADIDFHAAKHGAPAPDATGKRVIIVDFSFNLEILTAMADVAESVLVLDHHKTAQAALQDVPSAGPSHESYQQHRDGRLHALFDMNRSGAGLAWDFFFPGQPRPALINHIEDRDLWRFELAGTREILANLFSYPQDFEIWDGLFADEVSSLLSDGVAIERQRQKTVTDLIRSTQRRMVIGGHDVPVANIPGMFASDAGNIMTAGEAFAACYSDGPEGRSFSLRSTDQGVDVSEVASQYGGGGHRNASGFRVPFGHELTR
ncbi:DHHA1 domain-containing protein [Pseudomonas baltica]|uniref:DHH family phosphoesterase n=1 Tax=Pseudomonas baltica TaxID=2762576 RepID=UPI00289FC6D2|nr:DHHA1 domain-containing protein [Pseudomonas baltica]